MTGHNFYITNKKCKEQAKEYLRYSWKQSAQVTLVYYLMMLILALVVALPSALIAWWLVFPLLFLEYLPWSLFDYGYKKYFWDLTQLNKVSIKTLFCGFSKNAGKIMKTYLKKLFLSLGWFLLLIVPYFFKHPNYAMTTFILWDKPDEQNPIKESKHLMKKNKERFLNFEFSFTHWYLLVLVTAFVAGIWVMPYLATAEAVFYEDLKTDF